MPQYEHAVERAGGEPVRVPLDASHAEVMRILQGCDGVLLPGSSADVDPAHYRAAKQEKTAPADEPRHKLDRLLLEDAYQSKKPVLGICYGMQSLNVFRGGTLVQHIESQINHEAGRKVPIAHKVEIEGSSRLAGIVGNGASPSDSARVPQSSATAVTIDVNSSHHQSIEVAGEGLRIVGQCAEDRIVEAVESTSLEHFVVGVQWHPERSIGEDEPSPAIFRALIEAAESRKQAAKRSTIGNSHR